MTETNVLLDVTDLKTQFSTPRGVVTAVDQVSFHVNRGEIVGLVGESGCGKSVTAASLMRLLDSRTAAYEGEVRLLGKDLLALSEKEMRSERGRSISMVFQDPMTALNPVLTVGNQMVEAIRVHNPNISVAAAEQLAIEMFQKVSIPSAESRIRAYPHQLSGGMRQRVVIAMALCSQPDVLIADEPTTALDVTTQAQILDLIFELCRENQTGTLLITHDLGVVAQVCDRVLVMYLGEVIESASVEDLFDGPLHPYAIGLLGATPSIEGDLDEELAVIPGRVPSLHEVPQGCRFAARCAFATEQCRTEAPTLDNVTPTRSVRCWNYESVQAQREAA